MSTATATAPDDRALLLRIAQEAYDKSTWNETNLRSSIKSVDAHEAAWTPPHGRHGIAEIVLHCAYWKDAVRRRLLGDRRRTFPLAGKDWFEVPAPLTEERWTEIVRLLDEQHEKLCDAVRRTHKALAHATDGGREPSREVFGIAMHDAYHTGQIRSIRGQYARARRERS